MSNPTAVTLQLAAAVSNGIALSQSVAAAGPLTLNGTLVSGGVAILDVPRRVLLASSGNDLAVVFTIAGTNGSGAPITDTVTGLNGATTGYTTLDFLKVTSITSSAATVGSITAGTNGTGSTPWIVTNFLATVWELAVAVHIMSGSITYNVEHTFDDPNTKGPPPGGAAQPGDWSMEAASNVPALAWQHPVMSGLTADAYGNYAETPVFAIRLTITNGTGKAILQAIQAGIDD